MKQAKNLSLGQLMRTHRGEIDRLASGIRGESDSVLWTANMRAAVRGGKPCGGNRIDSPIDSKEGHYVSSR
jgi:hypothetical protein